MDYASRSDWLNLCCHNNTFLCRYDMYCIQIHEFKNSAEQDESVWKDQLPEMDASPPDGVHQPLSGSFEDPVC